MLGYPGAGKTTISRMISELTGAVHIWADHERKAMFGRPLHTQSENQKLYGHLNQVAEDLLTHGKSVIFDTNFNFFRDREHLRQIAAKHGAQTKLVWVTTPHDIAKERATNAGSHDTRVLGDMPPEQFERLAGNLEPPHDTEQAITINGIGVTPESLKADLGL
jgi:predicted kinase